VTAKRKFENFNGDVIMTIKTDPKSIVVGAAVAIVVLLSMATARSDQNIAADTDKTDSLKAKLSAVEQRLFQKLTTPQPGRFQVETVDHYAIILDTATGQAWKYSLSTNREIDFCPAKIKPAAD
jgi:hypothetical protein